MGGLAKIVFVAKLSIELVLRTSLACAAVAAIAVLFFAAAPLRARVLQVDIDGIVHPVTSHVVASAIAQAERAYQAEHGSYASLDDLTSNGAVTFEKRGRQGYSYEIQNPAGGFRVVAHCPAATNPGCSDYFIDQSMEVQTAH